MNGFVELKRELAEALRELKNEGMVSYKGIDLDSIVYFMSGFIIGSEYREGIHDIGIFKPDKEE